MSYNMAKIIKFIDSNYFADITLSTLSEKFNFSESYIARLFKNELNTTSVKYINHTAIQMLDLKESDNTFNKIFSERKKAFQGKDINLERIIYLDKLASSEIRIEHRQSFFNLYFFIFWLLWKLEIYGYILAYLEKNVN